MARVRATARHPQGWSMMVEQLAAAPDRESYLVRMLDLQCNVVAAEYGAIWTVSEENKLEPVAVWPRRAGKVESVSNPALRRLAEAAAAGYEKKTSHVINLEADAGGRTGAHAFVTVLRRKGEVDVVATAVAHVADPQVIASTAPLREVAAGLYDGFEAREQAAAYSADAERFRQAVALLAVSQDAPRFKGACLNLVTELAHQYQCTRVSLGWVRGPQVRLMAISDSEQLKRHSEVISLTEHAMDECLDQDQPIVCPLPEPAEPLLAQAIVYAHRRLCAQQPGRQVLSLPLRHHEELLGVLTLERVNEPFDAESIVQLQLIADVATPHLLDRRQGDRYLPVHAWHSVRDVLGLLVGPRHVAWKLVGLVVLVALLYCGFGTWSYRIGAPFVIEAKETHFVSAPFQGAVQSVAIRKGDTVAAGDLLGVLETHQHELQRDAALAERGALSVQRRSANEAQKQLLDRQIEQSKARIALLDDQINHAELRSPIDGVVHKGQWHDKLGVIVEQGEPMFEIAGIDGDDALEAVLHVDERDIDELTAWIGKSQGPVRGAMATRSTPDLPYRVELVRVLPMAGPADGVNSFEVRCRIIGDAAGLRPGMEGRAKLNAGQRRIAWIATHRIVETVRLWFW